MTRGECGTYANGIAVFDIIVQTITRHEFILAGNPKLVIICVSCACYQAESKIRLSINWLNNKLPNERIFRLVLFNRPVLT